MDTVHGLLRRVWRRAALNRALAIAAIGLTVALGLVALWRIVSSLVWSPADASGWWWALGAAAFFGIAVGLVWAAARTERGVALGRMIDERAGMREAVSTALCVEASDDAWSRATVAQAQRVAAGVDLRRTMPIEAPRSWPAPAVAVVVAVGAVLLPAPDIRGWFEGEDPAEREQAEARQAQAEVEATTAALAEQAERLGIDVAFSENDTADALGTPEQMTPEAIRSAAVKELTNLADQVAEQIDTPEQRARDALEQSLRRLRQPGPGPAEELSRSLARGEFDDAKRALESLAEQLRSGELGGEERERLAQQLESLSGQLARMAQEQSALERSLQQAGMSRSQAAQAAAQAASDPQALERALEQLEGLSPEQRQALMEQAQAAAESAAQCNALGDGLGQMAQAMMSESGSSLSQMQSAADALAGQLSDLEMLSQDMQSLQSMLASAQQGAFQLGRGVGAGSGTPGVGEWSAGDPSQQSQGSGGAGQGFGPSPEARETSTRTTAARSPVRTTDGPIIGSRLVYEGQVRGESRADFAVAAKAASSDAADAVESMRVPRAYENAVMRYFGALERRADDEQEPSAPEASADGDG
ncbi:MAG: hypothetical protein AAGB48_12925 [Planctomycetota bacterium]